MSDERKLILKMLQENRISVEEAEKLLGALDSPASQHQESKSQAGGPQAGKDSILEQAGPKVEQFMGSISSMIDNVATQWGPVIEKKFDNWFSQVRPNAPKHHSDFQETKTTEEVFPAPSESKVLKFKNPWGDVDIEGYDGTHIQAKITKEIGAQSPAELVKFEDVTLSTRSEGEILSLVFENTDGLQFDTTVMHVALKIPQSLNLDLSSYNYDVSLKNMSATQSEHQINSQSGDISFQNVAAKKLSAISSSGTIQGDLVTEHLHAESKSGDVTLKGSVFEGSAQTKSGFLRFEGAVHQKLSLESTSADISLNLLEGKGQLALKTTSGDIEISGKLEADAQLESSSGDLQGNIEVTGNAQVDMKSTSGDIDLMLEPASNCKLEIDSKSGDIEWRMELSGEESTPHTLRGNMGEGQGLLKASTSSGDVLLS